MASEPTTTGNGGRLPEHAGHAPGDLIARRYRVERHLGRGGMGEVYAVEDLLVGGHVALKTIRADAAGDPGLIERLRREMQLARQIHHRGVCRVFDLGRDEGGQVFLTMELLDGETLEERLERRGALPVDEAAPIVLGLARGLAAAHAAGVIHRDLKSANIMLVGDRTVILDFGVARAVAGHSEGLTNGVAGTPAYMAPEQREGVGMGPPVDVYAYGVVVHEMLAGRRPFEGPGTPARLARWDDVVRRCLDREPGRRPASRELAVLVGPPVTRWRALLVVAALGLAATGGITASQAPPEPPAQAARARRQVAVIGFRDLGAHTDSAWIATALSELLTGEVAAAESLRVVPGDTVATARPDLALPGANGFSPDALDRLHTALGADAVVHGRYVVSGGRLRVDVLAQETASGGTIVAFTETGTEAELLDVVTRAGRRLRLALGVDETTVARVAHPSSEDATRLYAMGLARLRHFDPLGAREHLTAAVVADPTFAMAHVALSQADELLGYEAQAAAEAETAAKLAGELARSDRMLVEARAAETRGHYPEAVRRYRALFEFFPDNLEYGIVLTHAQIQAGFLDESAATLAVLRQMPPPLGDDPRLDLLEADAARAAGDSLRRRDADIRAGRAGAARGARLTVAAARVDEGWARFFLGDMRGAEAAFAAGHLLAGSIGARIVVANAVSGAGLVLFQEGRVAEGRARFEENVTIRREVGDRTGLIEGLNNLGFVLEELGELQASDRMIEEALAIAADGDAYGAGYARFHRALTRQARGDLPGATADLGSSRATFARMGNDSVVAQIDISVGDIALQGGHVAQAITVLERSAATMRKISPIYAGYALHALGRARAAAGDVEGARALHVEALQTRREHAMLRVLPESVAELAGLDRDTGHAADAERGAREAAADLERVGSVAKAAITRALLAELLADRGASAEARAELAHGRRLVEGRGAGNAEIALDLAETRLGGSADDAAERAEQAGYAERALRARIAEARRDRSPRALAKLAEQCRAAGLVLLEKTAR